MMNSNVLLGLSVGAFLTFNSAYAQQSDANLRADAERIAIGTCGTCHGPQGHSISPKFPVLAGQHAAYLQTQMQAFKAQTRGDADAIGYMWGMSAPLSDPMIAALADYYSRESTGPGHRADPTLVSRGKSIYENGNAAEGIPGCASCHGKNAEGTDMYPRLAGQQVQYLMKQLHSFQSNMRDVAIMHGVAKGMQESEMKSVANYLRSLGS